MAAISPKTCDLCCHESDSWGVGECDHPTCLRCTAKLRALCDQRECPVCRLKLDTVIVCRKVKPFSMLPRLRYRGDNNYGMLFESHELYQEYETLRQNSCDKCMPKEIFRTSKHLRAHMNKAHDLHYCEICVDNLKLFPFEFKAYTRSLLTKHRREGDTDNTSHRGHPLCKFCDNRHLDNDVLHAHLRMDHFWCHICEGDGRQDYFKNYLLLRKHFKDEHFLCEEGPCREEKLTSVFRSKIDIQAHRAALHTHGLTKAEVKQMKQLELGFSYGGGRGDGGGGRSRAPPPIIHRTSKRREQEELEVATALSASLPSPNEEVKKPKKHSSTSTRTKKSPVEDTKPPPGFPSSASPGLENTQGMVELSYNGLNPYFNASSKTAEPEVSRPPGFENVSVPTVKPEKKVEREWPEITKTVEIVKQKNTQVVTESELTGLQKPSYVYGGPASSWTKTDKLESKKKPQFALSTTYVPKYTAEAFPSLSGGNKSTYCETMAADKSPLLRRQAASSVVEAIRSILDKVQFTTFKTLSGWYRNDTITADEYVAQCSALFGPKWIDYGPRLASVFPEEIKQLELMAFFQAAAPPAGKTKSKKKAKERTCVWNAQGGRQMQGKLNDREYPSLAKASTVNKVARVGAWNNAVVRI